MAATDAFRTREELIAELDALRQAVGAGAPDDAGPVLDTPHRRYAKDAARHSEHRFRQLADTMPQLVWTAGADGTVDYYNARSSDYAGLEKQRDGSWGWSPVLHPDDLDRTVDIWTHAVRTGTEYVCEHRVQMADGSHRWHLSRARLVEHADGEARWFGTATDIDDLKQEQFAHARSQRRLELAQQAARMGTFDWDIQRNINTWPPELESLYGLEPGTFAGTYEHWLDLVHPEDLDQAQQDITDAFESGEFSSEWRVRPDGDTAERWLAARGQVLKNEQGVPVRMLGAKVDITDHKLAEASLRQAKEELERANQTKDHFLAALSHELRTPLAPVLLSLEQIEKDPDLPPRLRRELGIIRLNVEMESRLIDDLLDLTRVTRGPLDLRHVEADLHEIIAYTVRSFGADACTVKKQQLELDLAADHHAVRGDPARLSQVIWNLLRNAVKFTPQGGRVRVSTTNPAPDRLRVEVHDTGVGIEPDVLPTIFEAFAQGGGGVTREGGGLGLGLFIVKNMVESHGGRVGVKSHGKDRGSTFSFELPAHAPTPATPPAPGPPSPVTTPTPGLGRRVLLVEDYPPMRRALQRVLIDLGFDVVGTATVEEALKAAADFGFELVVSDLGLPDGNGHDLMKALRREYGLRGVAVSGYGTEEDRRLSREAGFREHLVKPINADSLRLALERTLAAPRTP